MTDSDDSSAKRRDLTLRLASEAAQIVRERLTSPGPTAEKTPGDLVTEVDILAEQHLIAGIRKTFPGDAILGEESGGDIVESGFTWVLDPLDGTANFARGNPLHAVSICVLADRQPLHTAVAAPRLGELYHASRGQGAWRVIDGAQTQMHVGDVRSLDRTMLGVGSCFFGPQADPRSDRVAALISACWQMRSIGTAAVRGAWVAARCLDLSVAGASDQLWDSLPSVLLVEEAGGHVCDLKGQPWTLASDGLVLTNKQLAPHALEVLSVEH